MRMGVLLAAGASRRFGPQDKLLAPWNGRPLVTWSARALLAAGCDALMAVVASPAVADLLPAGIECRRVAGGLPMSASLKTALREAQRRQAQGLLVCLGDMPDIAPETLRRLQRIGGTAACIQGDRRLPPVHIAAEDFGAALALPEGDHGARALVADLPADRLVPIPAAAAR